MRYLIYKIYCLLLNNWVCRVYYFLSRFFSALHSISEAQHSWINSFSFFFLLLAALQYTRTLMDLFMHFVAALHTTQPHFFLLLLAFNVKKKPINFACDAFSGNAFKSTPESMQHCRVESVFQFQFYQRQFIFCVFFFVHFSSLGFKVVRKSYFSSVG